MTKHTLSIWGVTLDPAALSDVEQHYLSSLPQTLPSVEWVWAEMDRVWSSLGLDNRRSLAGQPVDEFYAHPVWLMNGIFTAANPESVAHRQAIARYIGTLAPSSVADYGAGFGELARVIAGALPNAQVAVIEPYATTAAKDRIVPMGRISFTTLGAGMQFDVVIAQDVLEHVDQPVALAVDLAAATRPGGTVIFANNFTPVIACHLPRTFHLRRTFRAVMRALGLRYQGVIDGAPHAQVFVVGPALRPRAAHAAATVSRLVGPALEAVSRLAERFKSSGTSHLADG